MAKRTLKFVFDKAQRTLAREAEAQLWETAKHRYKDPGKFTAAVREFETCRYWQDAGFISLADYAQAVYPHAKREEWVGWTVLSRIQPPAAIFRLLREGRLKVERLAPLGGVLTQYNYRTWLFLALYLTRKQLKAAAVEFRRLSESGYCGEAVFVPLWVPLADYRRYFDDDQNSTSPAWNVLARRLSERP